jgi:hypothetical protein
MIARQRSAKRGGTKRGNLFEFYAVLDDSITDTKNAPRFEPCDPPHQHATKSKLGQVCAETYGAGNFVALEVGADAEGRPQGLPVSYWVIKFKHGRAPVCEEVFPDDAMLRARRQTLILDARKEDVDIKLGEIEHCAFWEFKPADDDRYAHLFEPFRWQRYIEAVMVANLFLEKVADPEFKEKTSHKHTRQRAANNPRYDMARKLFPSFLTKHTKPTEALHQLILSLGEPGYNKKYRARDNGEIRRLYKRALGDLWKKV